MSVSSPLKKKSKQDVKPLLRFYRTPYLLVHAKSSFLKKWELTIENVSSEICFYIELKPDIEALTLKEMEILKWLLSETFEPQQFAKTPFFPVDSVDPSINTWHVEIGPRMSFSTPWASNAVAICHACGLSKIKRLERSRIFVLESASTFTDEFKKTFLQKSMDRMTEQVYVNPLQQFTVYHIPTPVRHIPIMSKGKSALEEINEEIGLGFDDWDLEYYTNLFKNKLKRDPTDVECFDMGQSNSEHSRHWFFGGKLVINGKEMPHTLFQMVKATLTNECKKNSIIAFKDNSSAIRGCKIRTIAPSRIGEPCAMQERHLVSHVLLTAETHNFPSGVAPFPGAETGTGGRIRDVQATGRGAHVIAGVNGYSVGNLLLDGYPLPWEDVKLQYPSNLATPRDIIIQTSNGASDYGNKFGEPVVTGFTRSFGMVLENKERREYIKPIMFSAGIGQLNAIHCVKGNPENNLWVVKVGGPCYRIGMGGGAASSRIQDVKNAELDFNAVQRGDAEMENKMNRVIRSCCELNEKNPIVTIHDQGAGGNGNVLKEIVEPSEDGKFKGGAKYDVRNILIGDETLSVLEIWGAEYQENNALLIKEQDKDLFASICLREKCPFSFLGQVTGDGKVVLFDSTNDTTPVNLDLDLVLGKMPQKTFTDTRSTASSNFKQLSIPANITVKDALDRVLRLLSVGSKRFLTNKVDRCVTGLVAQQQCVGPLHTPLSNCGVVAQSHFRSKETGLFSGIATACGEQPIKGLISPTAMARLTVGESLTNLVWSCLASNDLRDIKCSANWMWAAKLENECARMYDCCSAMATFMKEIGVAVDGGKDSLSMAAKVGKENVKAPGTLVVTMYGAVSDVEKTVTPDLKPQCTDSSLYYIDFGDNQYRLGGSALAQCYSQTGKHVPDVKDSKLFKNAFMGMQKCIKNEWIEAGHDRSDGGLVVTLLEMAFSGNCGLEVNISWADNSAKELKQLSKFEILQVLFAEELGYVFQVSKDNEKDVLNVFQELRVKVQKIGSLRNDGMINININNQNVLQDRMVHLRDVWEATSFELAKLQSDPECVALEQASLRKRQVPKWSLSFTPSPTAEKVLLSTTKPRVAVLREEGSNGDREMCSAFYSVGFEVWDITMTDLVNQKVTIDEKFRGLVFVGGFSFADVMGSAKGWAGVVRYHANVLKQLEHFKNRANTFSLGVCNGCQLMSLLGWVNPPIEDGVKSPSAALSPRASNQNPRFIENRSNRLECRFSSIRILQSNAVLLQNMANSSFGVWVAHGEGRAYFPSDASMQSVLKNGLAPIRYVNDVNEITESYPFNPNGSPHAIAGLVSSDGRHLCMMPHPERCFLKYQWPYMTKEIASAKVSPWLRMFQNAKTFCDTVQ